MPIASSSEAFAEDGVPGDVESGRFITALIVSESFGGTSSRRCRTSSVSCAVAAKQNEQMAVHVDIGTHPTMPAAGDRCCLSSYCLAMVPYSTFVPMEQAHCNHLSGAFPRKPRYYEQQRSRYGIGTRNIRHGDFLVGGEEEMKLK